jgi:hypothetical protein
MSGIFRNVDTFVVGQNEVLYDQSNDETARCCGTVKRLFRARIGAGTSGMIVEVYESGVFEVEFSDT